MRYALNPLSKLGTTTKRCADLKKPVNNGYETNSCSLSLGPNDEWAVQIRALSCCGEGSSGYHCGKTDVVYMLRTSRQEIRL